MSAHDQLTRTALENQAFALMARLHVALRRGSGRVTDVEYMRVDPGYCRHILDLAAGSASEEMRQLGIKLEAIYFGENGLFIVAPSVPLLNRAAAEPVARRTFAPPDPHTQDAAALEAAGSRDAAPASRDYIGRLR